MKLSRRMRVRLPRKKREQSSLLAPTPILVSPRLFAFLVVLGIAVLALALYAAPTVIVIALGGTALAIVLSYPVGALSQVMPRPLAILTTFLSLLGIVALALIIIVPLLIEQLSGLIELTPDIAAGANQFLLDLLKPLEERNLLRGANSQQVVNDLVDEFFDRVRARTENLLSGLVGYVSGALNVGVSLFGALFVAAYLLVDLRKVKAVYLRMVPPRYRRDAQDLWNSFDESLSRYLGGLVFVVILQGALVSLALWILDVNYALLLGAWVSVTAIIPYLGAFLGAIPAVVLALFDPNPLSTTVLVIIVYVLIQQLESNILTPRIQGRALHVHPIIVLLAVIAGGELAGLWGVIFAVPTLAVLRVIFDFLRVRLRTNV